MATTTLQAGTRTLLAGSDTAINGLLSATYVVAGIVNVSASNPVDYLVEVTVTPGATTNKQVFIFAKISTDGTNYTSGPETLNSATDEIDLYLLGILPLNSASTAQTKAFSVFNALGFVPPYAKIILKNDTGATLPSAGHSVYITPINAITA